MKYLIFLFSLNLVAAAAFAGQGRDQNPNPGPHDVENANVFLSCSDPSDFTQSFLASLDDSFTKEKIRLLPTSS